MNQVVAKPKERDGNIEVYRVTLMFGIVSLHCLTAGEYNKPWLSNILLSCVNGFVFITGYFGLKFAPSKIVRLVCTSIFCGFCTIGYGLFFNTLPNVHSEDFIVNVHQFLYQ